MMTWIGNVVMYTGACISIIASVGLFKFKHNKISRVHAAGLMDVVAFPIMSLGLLLMNFSISLLSKILAINIMLWVTSATSSYLACKNLYGNN